MTSVCKKWRGGSGLASETNSLLHSKGLRPTAPALPTCKKLKGFDSTDTEEMEDAQNLIQSTPNPQPEQAVPPQPPTGQPLQPLAGQPQPPPQARAPYYPQPAYPVSGKNGREH